MQFPTIPNDNRILVERTRANKEVMLGIENQVASLFVLDWKKRAVEFTIFFAFYGIGALVCYFSQSIFLIIIGIVSMGIAINSLPIFIHEGLHGLLANNPRLNHFITFLVGIPIMVSATGYYTTHVNHHYELGRKLDYGTYKQHTRKPFFVWLAYFLQITLGSFLYIAFIPFLSFKAAKTYDRFFIIWEYCALIAIYALFFTLVPAHIVITYWLYPAIVMCALTQLRALGSHALGDVENIYLSSRTIESSRIISFLFLYENYHLEHHVFPRTPSYNLKEMHELVWNRFPEAIYSKSYPSFLWGMIKAALKNDLQPMGVVHPRQDK